MWPFWYICRLSSFALLGECLQNWGPRLRGGQCDGCHVSAASEDSPLPPSTLGGPCCHGLGLRAGGKDEEGHPPKDGAGRHHTMLHEPWSPQRAAGSAGHFLPGSALPGLRGLWSRGVLYTGRLIPPSCAGAAVS